MKNPTLLRHIQRVWTLSFYLLLSSSLSLAASTVAMDDRTDIMGQYTLLNSVQCQRLCWYRKLCTAYSYNDILTTGANCVLHADSLEGDLVVHRLPACFLLLLLLLLIFFYSVRFSFGLIINSE